MAFGRKWAFQSEEGAEGSAGGGAGAAGTEGSGTPPPPPTPAEPAGGNEPKFDMDAGVSQLAADLFGKSDDDKEPPAATPAPTSAPAATPAPTAAPAAGPSNAPPPADTNKPPTTWTPAAQAEWDKLSPVARAEIHKREQDMWKGIAQYKGEADFARSIRDVLKPAGEKLAGRVSPVDFVKAVSDTHLTLSNQQTSVADRVTVANTLLKAYGLPLIGQQAAASPPAGPAGNETYVDPEVAGLREELASLKSRLNEQDQRTADTTRQTLSQELEKFAADPAHPYFYEVADDIVVLLRGSGGQMPLKDAYDRAVYANPATRQKETDRVTAAALEKARKEDSERAAAAKKASGANVNAGKHQGSATAAAGSMDDTMEETMKAIRQRG